MDDLITSDQLGKAMEKLSSTGAKEISFERNSGFEGIDEFKPPGWKMEVINAVPPPLEPEGEAKPVYVYPEGVGAAMISNCLGKTFGADDPCHDLLKRLAICDNPMDSARFIGVGFDGRGFYSTQSRKRSIIQRICSEKQTFMGKTIPDVMNAFGVYDYSVTTRTFQSATQYVEYLQEKAATSKQKSMFHMEASALQKSQSSGGNFGMVGALAGAAIGAYAGGTEGAQMGSKIGQAIGSSIGFNNGKGSGSSSSDSKSENRLSGSSEQESSKGSGSSTNMLAVLEADLKLYELVLDEVKPEDLSVNFLSDVLRLPTSYFHIDADRKLQSFILRWGTHYIKSAKFGGQLKVMKTSKRNSKLSEEEFSAIAQTEFSAMFSTLKSSFEQKESGWSFLGFGSKERTSSQSSTAEGGNKNEKNFKSDAKGRKDQSLSEFIQTSVEAKGGDSQIALAVADFYTPNFRPLFSKWLSSIPKYPKPYEFTLGQISEILDMNDDSLFKQHDLTTGCFSKSIKTDETTGMTYFLRPKIEKDETNTEFQIKEKNPCKFGDSTKNFTENLASIRISLERAESIYMAEGPFSTTSFEIDAGHAGCELDTIRYMNSSMEPAKTWPAYSKMKKEVFKVVFDMPLDLPAIEKNAEFSVRYYRNRWYTTSPDGEFSIHDSCSLFASQYEKKHVVCVEGLPLLYDEDSGYLRADSKVYKDLNITVPFWLNGPIAQAESNNLLKSLQHSTGSVAEVPCKVLWTNSHRLDPQEYHNCIHFTAASSGDIFILFAAVPKDYTTWYYLQLSPSGAAFYHAMTLEMLVTTRGSGTLGDDKLFETFFVCISQGNGNLAIQYGKAPAQSYIGQVLASYEYPMSSEDRVSFYTFGTGEAKIILNDVRVIKERPSILQCTGEGLIKDETGNCVNDCDKQCKDNTCRRPLDPKECHNCKNVQMQTEIAEGTLRVVCLVECPVGFELNGNKNNCKKCKFGYFKDIVGNVNCTLCPGGWFSNTTGQSKCDVCKAGSFSKEAASSCTPCPGGSSSGHEGQSNCDKCNAGEYQDEKGQEFCKNCPKGHYSKTNNSKSCLECAAGSYNDQIGQVLCKPCPLGSNSTTTGAQSCLNNCAAGTFSPRPGIPCEECQGGTYSGKGATSCDSCNNGTYSLDGANKCIECDVGTYQPAKNATSCLKCDPGQFQSAKGKSICELCRPGNHQSSPNMTSCNVCPKGTYQQLIGQSKCWSCALGTYQPKTAQKSHLSCLDCVTGTYGDAMGLAKCKECPAGTYQGKKKQMTSSTCKKCSVGTFQSSPGQASCTPCRTGTYQPEAGQKSCKKCPSGQYQPSAGKTSCTQCTAGYYQPSTGQVLLSSCKKCPAGTYQSSKGQSACRPCPAGKYSNSGYSSCTDCPRGQYQPSAGKASCLQCAAGQYQPSTGQILSKSCKQCSAGTYQPSKGQSACRSCPAGKYSSSGSSRCTDCPRGQNQPSTGKSSCNICPAGQYQPHPGKSNCIECPAGQYQRSAGYANCNKCPSGQYQPYPGKPSCINCPAGQYQGNTGKTNCNNCPKGQYQANRGKSSCNYCSANTYQPNYGRASCFSCGSGYYQTSSGMTYCNKDLRSPGRCSCKGNENINWNHCGYWFTPKMNKWTWGNCHCKCCYGSNCGADND